MSSLKGSQTEVNILTAFAGESQARNRYTFAASIANKEGYAKIASIFLETADQEKEHAKRLFRFLEGGEAVVSAAFPAGLEEKTSAQLAAAAAGERHEWTVMYPEFATIARQEGFKDISTVMEGIAVAEKYHEKRFAQYLEEIRLDKHFTKPYRGTWRCRNCGYIHESFKALDSCPVCAHPKAYFEFIARDGVKI
ncbi:MAG: rubrerythrin family protein [Deltaproteobacteria bacterium]|jgi:rubrerythrin|nr:rubrerythrin family protein [Deltaproteobacteria bacterium]